MGAMSSRVLERHDRLVSRARLRMAAGSPARLLAFRAEEALRLCALPGEETGRVYHFRRLHVAGLPANGERRVWLEAFQRELTQLARGAVHGLDPHGARGDAVFFHSRAEACQALLGLLARRRAAEAWYWPAVSGSAPGARAADRLVDLIESLRASPASWSAVGSAVFGALDADCAVPLLALLPDAAAGQWLAELGGDRAPWPAPVAAAAQRPGAWRADDAGANGRGTVGMAFVASTQAILARAAAALGGRDGRVLWLASLSVVLARPSALEDGTAVAVARASLLDLAPTAQGPRAAPRQGGANVAGVDSSGARQVAAIGRAELLRVPAAMAHDRIESRNASSIQRARPVGTLAPDLGPAGAVSMGPQGLGFGQATQGAGLYFLLNALRRLRRDADPFDPWFLAHFFLHAASLAGIEAGDPILRWANEVLEQPGASAIERRRVRLWALEVRRWCARTARISVSEIVRRPGEVTLTRTELDVSLPLDLADIRIRRVGLDLDPGWLPWFGRVVRFHYVTSVKVGGDVPSPPNPPSISRRGPIVDGESARESVLRTIGGGTSPPALTFDA
jgi:hypothetical protein